MLARDIMTRNVATVGPATPVDAVARILLTHHISGVPVVDEAGTPIGVVSEWDLVGRHTSGRTARREAWLAHLARGSPLSADFLSSVDPTSRTAGELADRAPITVTADTDVADVAEMIVEHRIGRVFVTENGRLAGVVSRHDLIRAAIGIEGRAGGRSADPVVSAPPPTAPVSSTPVEVPDTGRNGSVGAADFSAASLRRMVGEAAIAEQHRRRAFERAREEERRRRITALAETQLDETTWHDLLARARTAAARGASETLLLRFPSELCTDRGRAINAPDPAWPKTLRGIAAEIFRRWEKDLKPAGFGLTAQILDFPGGFPGDAGLTLRWGG